LKKTIGILFMHVLIFFLFYGNDVNAEFPVEQINKIAQSGFEQIKDPVFNLDFCSPEDWDNAVLDKGFPIYTIKEKNLLDRKESVYSLADLVEPTRDWYFIVKSGSKAVAMLFVGEINGKWQITGVGHAGIARELDEMSVLLENYKSSSFRLIRFFGIKADFLEISTTQGYQSGYMEVIGYMPFISARIALDFLGYDNGHSILKESAFIDKLIQKAELAKSISIQHMPMSDNNKDGEK